jgi:uncharacterized damage-inducible protein DinB
VLQHVPEDKLAYKPHEKLRDFAGAANHIYQSGIWFANIMKDGKVDFAAENNQPPAPKTKSELIASCERLNKDLIQSVKALTPDLLTREIPFASFGTFPAVTFIDWHLSHMIHHRGQLTVYLRTMGAKVPAVYGDSLDYPFKP